MVDVMCEIRGQCRCAFREESGKAGMLANIKEVRFHRCQLTPEEVYDIIYPERKVRTMHEECEVF